MNNYQGYQAHKYVYKNIIFNTNYSSQQMKNLFKKTVKALKLTVSKILSQTENSMTVVV